MNTDLFYSNIPLTKTEQAELGDSMKRNLLEGNISPIEAIVKAKSLYETLGAFLKDEEVKECVINECGKYGKGENPSFAGAVIQVKDAAVKIDYSNCGDPVYERLCEEMDLLKSQMKEREAELKALSKSRTVVDEETGEVYTLRPPVRSASTTYSITFKR